MPAGLGELTGGAPVAALLLAALAGFGLAGLYVAPALVERNLLRPYWLAREREWATLVTAGFVHADLAHLLFNGFTFWAFGFALERRIGPARFAALYFLGLLAAHAGTWLRHRRDPGYRSLGASGAILAVLFAAIVYVPTASIVVFPIPLPIPAPLFAVGYLAYTAWAARQGRGRINHDAHLAGAIFGLAFVAASDPQALLRALRSVFA